MREIGIYKIYWPGKSRCFYYGQSINLTKRKKEHFNSLKKSKHKNIRLQSLFNQFGLPEFKVVKKCSISELSEIEQVYLDASKDNPDSCNIYFIASSASGYKWSYEQKQRQSVFIKNRIANGYKPPVLLGSKNPFYNKKHSAESIIKQRQSKAGKKLGGSNPNAILVINVETGIFYDCIKEAATTTGVNAIYLSRMLSGERKNKTSFIYA